MKGGTIEGPSEISTVKPMKLGKLTDFFLSAWSLLSVLKMNFEGDVELSLNFFKAKSEFYHQFDALCRQMVIEAFPASSNDED
jgi:hypothetical protein